MGWRQGGFNVACNLVAVALVALFDWDKINMESGFWGMFFDFKLNYFLFFVFVNFFFVVFVTNRQKKNYESQLNNSTKRSLTLKDIANGKKDKECALWDYSKIGYSVVQTNNTWQEWIKGLLKTTDRLDLDYYNFGDEYYFFDLATGREISIPTGNRARNERVGDSFRNGMVVRLMPKET